MAMTDLDTNGLVIPPQDLAGVTTGDSDDARLYYHNGASLITLSGGDETDQTGYYQWNAASNAWDPMETYEPPEIGRAHV